jgi:hypothetical protein
MFEGVVEISLPKLAMAWMLLIGFPSIILGVAPLLLSLWIGTVSWKAYIILTGIWPVVLLSALGVLAWFAGLPLARLIESSFWSLNALGVQPVYIACREGLRHLADRLLPRGASTARRASVRAASAAASGLAISGAALWLIVLAWPVSRWVGNFADLVSPHLLIPVVLAHAIVIIASYFGGAAFVWGIADATMAQPRDLPSFDTLPQGGRLWRVAHLSDIHVERPLRVDLLQSRQSLPEPPVSSRAGPSTLDPEPYRSPTASRPKPRPTRLPGPRGHVGAGSFSSRSSRRFGFGFLLQFSPT